MLQSSASWCLWLDSSCLRSQVRLAVSAAAERKPKMTDALAELEDFRCDSVTLKAQQLTDRLAASWQRITLSNLVSLDMKNMSLRKYSAFISLLPIPNLHFQPACKSLHTGWILPMLEVCPTSTRTERSTRNHHFPICPFQWLCTGLLSGSPSSCFRIKSDLTWVWSSALIVLFGQFIDNALIRLMSAQTALTITRHTFELRLHQRS